MRNRVQRVALVDDMDAGCDRRGSDRLAGRWRHRRYRRGRRGDGCRRARNDQLLPRRQRTGALIAIGPQDLRGRNIVAACQQFQRIAGADDDRGAARCGVRGRRDRPRYRTGGLDLRMGRLSVGHNPAPASRNAGIRRRIGLRRRNRGRRQRLGLVLRRLRARILGQFAASRRLRGHRAGRLGVEREGIFRIGILRQARGHVGTATGKSDRHQRQDRDLRHPARAKQLDECRHGYSLIRNKILF